MSVLSKFKEILQQQKCKYINKQCTVVTEKGKTSPLLKHKKTNNPERTTYSAFTRQIHFNFFQKFDSRV